MEHIGAVTNINPKPKVAESFSAGRTFSLLRGGDRSKTGAKVRRHHFDCRPIPPGEIRVERFWPKVDKNGPVPANRPDLGPCWLWTGAKNTKGYGSLKVAGKSILAHRVAVVLDCRELAAGDHPDHLCLNPSCVNPRHLEVVTIAENNRRQARNLVTHCLRGHREYDSKAWHDAELPDLLQRQPAEEHAGPSLGRIHTEGLRSMKRIQQPAARMSAGFSWRQSA